MSTADVTVARMNKAASGELRNAVRRICHFVFFILLTLVRKVRPSLNRLSRNSQNALRSASYTEFQPNGTINVKSTHKNPFMCPVK
jgi:hypothetical protein